MHLKRAILDRKVKAEKLKESVKKGGWRHRWRDVELKPEEYDKYLTLAYKEEKFAKPKNVVGLNKSLPVPEMEQLMLANINADDSEMRELAEASCVAARDWLVEKGRCSRRSNICARTEGLKQKPVETNPAACAEFSLR